MTTHLFANTWFKPLVAVRRFAHLSRRFSANTAGNVMLIFSLMMIPILTGIGAAVDFGRAFMIEQKLTQAIDAAALAVGATPNLTQAQMQELAENVVNANYDPSEIGAPSSVTVTVDGSKVIVNASANMPTILLGLAGLADIDISVVNEVVRESKALEIALVLDNTGSMGSGGKISALRDASHTLVDIMFGQETVHPKLKISLVPFSQAVNVGQGNVNAFWMDTNAQSSIHGQNFAPGVNIFDLYDQIPNISWNGCVESRPEPYDTNDAVPTSGTPDTLWVPYFYPDEPDISWGYYNNYMNDGIGGSVPGRQRNFAKYDGSPIYSAGPLRGCSIPPLTPLTNIRADLDDAIDEFIASGYTHIPIGLAWGLRTLSPSEPFTEGVEFNDEETEKALILLTDGYNTLPTQWTHNGSRYTAYGYVSESRFNTNNYNNALSKLGPKTLELCDLLKESSVRVYTITFQLSNGPIKDLFRDCASEPGLYFDSPDNEQLQITFTAIARDLANLRISK
ncbi:MAG: pilus assembly protein TadG-related protein [Alphaproteobacteria bacterium]